MVLIGSHLAYLQVAIKKESVHWTEDGRWQVQGPGGWKGIGWRRSLNQGLSLSPKLLGSIAMARIKSNTWKTVKSGIMSAKS